MGMLSAKLKTYKLTEDEFAQLAKIVRERILSVAQPTQIYIFGSYARGVLHDASDLDISVVFESSELLKLQKAIILRSKLFIDYPTDMLFYLQSDFENKSEIGGVCAEIKREGKLIYDKRTKV
jgi:predicted nucleotidyltransferase